MSRDVFFNAKTNEIIDIVVDGVGVYSKRDLKQTWMDYGDGVAIVDEDYAIARVRKANKTQPVEITEGDWWYFHDSPTVPMEESWKFGIVLHERVRHLRHHHPRGPHRRPLLQV